VQSERCGLDEMLLSHTLQDLREHVDQKPVNVVSNSLWLKKVEAELRSVTCHMGSHSVTCHLTQVNVPRLNPSHAGRYFIYQPRRDGRLS